MAYSGKLKNEFSDRLGDGWRKLADLLDIKSSEQNCWARGHEAREIWEWLERRNQLAVLPGILQEIQRDDLASTLNSPIQETGAAKDFYQSCIERWSTISYALDKSFVELTLLLDQGSGAQGSRWKAKSETFQTLQQVLEATPAPLVLLGPPGCGKSTLLRHFELDNAKDALATLESGNDTNRPFTFFVPLNEFKASRTGESPPHPLQWLSERWTKHYPTLPELPVLIQSGRVTLLLDALNEIPFRTSEVIPLWKDFLIGLSSKKNTSRVIFSCRSLDYSAPLSTDDNPVQQVRIEALSDAKVEQFLLQHSPEHGEKLWANLDNTDQLNIFRSPFYLKMLIDESIDGEIPNGRAALFTAFVRRLFKREIEKGNSRFEPGELVHQRDILRLIHTHRGKTPWELPKRGILLPKISSLAYAMQQQHDSAESGQVKVDYDDALNLLNHPLDEKIIQCGVAMDILEQDLEQDQVFYIHQLIQEYFAAHHFLEKPEFQLAKQEWQQADVVTSLAETLENLPDSDPLPPLPATGWEETLALASAMQQNPAPFIAELMPVNLALAGRCASQPDVKISGQLKHTLQLAMLERMQDPKADLRARIAAGFALGELGDPRLQKGQGTDVGFLLPPMSTIPGGEYTIGSDEGIYKDEAPAHPVTLKTFQIARFPVTNAEWALFMKAGGYEDERWWQSAAAQAWRQGKNTDAGPKQRWRKNRKNLQENFNNIRDWVKQGRITSKQADDWELIAQWNDDKFEAWLEEQLPGGKSREPKFWFDEAFNHPAQPVVGICRHEAHAYCAWLNAQSKQVFRLPSEAEWEAAARGLTARRFAYGNDFDNKLSNTFESHIRKTTPPGVFPGGATSEGLMDMSGNVWEWTDSLFLNYPYKLDHALETVENTDDPRVVRGGSWRSNQDSARAAYRDNYHPDNRYVSLGFRLVSSSPII